MTLRHRLRGIGQCDGCALLMRGSRVHGRGLRDPVAVTGIDTHGTILATVALEPGRRVCLPGASWVLEQSIGSPGPPEGARLRWERASARPGSPAS